MHTSMRTLRTQVRPVTRCAKTTKSMTLRDDLLCLGILVVLYVVLVVRITSLMTSSFYSACCYDSCISTCSSGYESIRGERLFSRLRVIPRQIVCDSEHPRYSEQMYARCDCRNK